MKIVATILMNNCGDMVMDAIASVIEQVDLVIGIDTEVGGNASVALAKLAAKEKFRRARLVLPRRVRPSDPELTFVRGWNGSAADARNFALQQAAIHKADWALTLDTDERLHWNDLALRATLATNPQYDVWLMTQADGSYAKERLFRIPARGCWVGRTHEAYTLTVNNHRPLLPRAAFSELGKSAEQNRAKFERDERALLLEIADSPNDPRWRYYLGATYYELGEWAKAVDAWRACLYLHGWAEEAAWAAYRAAVTCNEHLDDPRRAKDLVGLGLARMITPELCWYAGYLAHREGRNDEAVIWGQQALLVAEHGPVRINFRWLPAWAEKPHELLHYAWAALGDEDAARWHLMMWRDPDHVGREDGY